MVLSSLTRRPAGGAVQGLEALVDLAEGDLDGSQAVVHAAEVVADIGVVGGEVGLDGGDLDIDGVDSAGQLGAADRRCGLFTPASCTENFTESSPPRAMFAATMVPMMAVVSVLMGCTVFPTISSFGVAAK